MSPGRRSWAWAALGLALVGLLALGARSQPTSGQSEDRVYAIASRMKCLQCVGESVANSQAQIAVQMRAEIRTQMRAGRHDDEILTYFADRYGQRVLLDPPSSGLGALVWIVPVVVVAAASAGLAGSFARSRRRREAAGGVVVSPEDRALVEAARTPHPTPAAPADNGADTGAGDDDA